MANITKRNNTYLIRVSDGYDLQGKKITRSMTYKPAPNMTEKQIAKELNKVAVQFEEKVKNGLVSNNPNITFAEFIPQYLAIKKPTLSPSTYEKYETALNSFIVPQLGHLKLSAMKPIHIQNFIKWLSETPCTHKFKNGEVMTVDKIHSSSTVRRYLAIVQSVLNQAVKLEIIPDSPAKASKLTLPKIVKPEIEIFTKQEAAQMLECLECEPLQYKVLIQLAIMTGARLGELVALKFSDVDFVLNKITIERAAVKIKGKPVTTKPPKDYEARSVAVSSYLIEMIAE